MLLTSAEHSVSLVICSNSPHTVRIFTDTPPQTCNAPHSHIDSAAAAPQQPPGRQVPPPILCPHRACVPAEVGMGVVHAVQYQPGTWPRCPALEKRWRRVTVARSYAPVTPASGTCSSTCAAPWYAAWSAGACSARAPPQARARARSAALGALAFALRPLRLPTPRYAPPPHHHHHHAHP